MYLHLGRDYVLNDRDVIGIFNLETTTISPRGREFLNYAQKNGAVVSLSDELPQSYVLADSSKFDLVKANHFAELHDMDMLITDNKLSLDWRDFLNNAQINLKLV